MEKLGKSAKQWETGKYGKMHLVYKFRILDTMLPMLP